MGISIQSNCNGCETCRNCGRGDYKVYLCDDCDTETDELYDYDGDLLCERCTKQRIVADSGFIDEFFDEIVEKYGIERRNAYEIV